MVMIWSKGISIDTFKSDLQVYCRQWEGIRLFRKGFLFHRKRDSGEDLVVETKVATYIFERVVGATEFVVAIRKVLAKTTDEKVTYIPLDSLTNIKFRYKKMMVIEKPQR